MMRPSPFRHPPMLLLVFVCIFSAGVAVGQLTSADRENLLGVVRSASDQLDPGELPNLAVATNHLVKSIDELRAHLDRTTDAENREAWLRYFDLEPLIQAIELQEPVSKLLKEAMIVRGRMIGTAPGLEMKSVVALRDAIDFFIDALRFRNADQSIAMLENQLESLSEMVRAMDDCPSPEQFNAISARLALLESSRLTPDVVTAFRDTFNQSNAAIMIGSTLVNEAIRKPVLRKRPVRDCILGTRLVGNATLQGNVRASLFPSIGTAQVGLRFEGTVVTENTGYNGPVRLKTESYAEVASTLMMTVDALGIQFGQPSTEADLSTRITRIDHKLALVRAIARKQAAKKKLAADRIAVEKLRSQIANQFLSESSEVSPVTPTDLLSRSEPLLQRLALTKPTQSWSSTKDAISIDSVFRGSEQLGSVVPRPRLVPPFSFAVQIHESAVENAFSVMLAGRTLNEKRLNELLEKVGQTKAAATEEADESAFEISFSRSRPVVFEARSESLRLGLRGTRFVQGDRAPLVKALEITAVYKPLSVDKGKVVMQRVGQVRVDFPRARLTLREVGLKKFIQRKFDEIFPELILETSPKIGQDAKVKSLRGREFRSSLVDMCDGWLSIAFQ